MKKISGFILILLFISSIRAQIPQGYYDDAIGQHGANLQNILHNIIDDHNVETYSELWDDFEFTDKKSNGKVWDMYSDNPGGTPPYQFTFISDQCGNYSQEGDCYNREHSFPKSWFGGEIPPMYTDLFHLYPTDGWVNNKRGNLPYGETNNPDWTSMNGSKVGDCSYPGYSGQIFEPIDEYKGDLARTYFYMATRYYNEDNSWPGSDMVNGAQPKSWALDMLSDWHEDDPVSQKEIDRNSEVYNIQSNRNPFIDHPEFVEEIWFYTDICENEGLEIEIKAWPIPFCNALNIHLDGVDEINNISICLVDISGKPLRTIQCTNHGTFQIETTNLDRGVYFLEVKYSNKMYIKNIKLIK